tara:strand:+ start:624 stop:1142 length:519 start_codon:yes stop_codon:yes gene_type:complete
MDRIGAIQPEYVWLTSGTGRWTNEKSAAALAKRAAGIDVFKIIDVSEVIKHPVTLVGREEFIKLSRGSKFAYKYGEIVQAQEGEALNGEISVINTDIWGGIFFNIYSGDKKVTPFSEKEVILEFEFNNKGVSPKPFTITERVVRDDYKTNYCLIVAAMIIGKPYEHSKGRTD